MNGVFCTIKPPPSPLPGAKRHCELHRLLSKKSDFWWGSSQRRVPAAWSPEICFPSADDGREGRRWMGQSRKRTQRSRRADRKDWAKKKTKKNECTDRTGDLWRNQQLPVCESLLSCIFIYLFCVVCVPGWTRCEGQRPLAQTRHEWLGFHSKVM